jgi:branched-chain amino acid transport system substrate-binding protein
MRDLKVLLALLVLLALFLCSCGPQTATQKSQTIVLGFTTSQTGTYTAESKEQSQGLQLWADQVTAAGGIVVGDTKVLVTFKSYDDASNKDQATALYTKLITEDKVDFLFGPYSSGLGTAAATVAEQNGKLMIAAGVAADSAFNKGFRHIFQVYTPGSRYLTGALDMLRAADPAATKVAIVYENESFAISVATAARQYAEQQKLQVVLFETYDTGTTDFAAIVDEIAAAQPDAVLGGGHSVDGTALAQRLQQQKVPVKLICLLVAPAMPEFAGLGDAAYDVTGPSQWEPQARYGPEGAQGLGIPFYGPTVAEFVQAYKGKYGYEPGYHAAAGYAAGLLLQRALEAAGSLDPASVRTALEQFDVMTYYGRIKFDTGTHYGLQIGHEMVYLQWQRDTAGQLAKQVVWPAAGKSAALHYPRQIP